MYRSGRLSSLVVTASRLLTLIWLLNCSYALPGFVGLLMAIPLAVLMKLLLRMALSRYESGAPRAPVRFTKNGITVA